MLVVDYKRYAQTPEDLRHLAVESPHPRSRERFMALYEIVQGTNATEIARRTGRNHQTVHGWVHLYNQSGPDALVYRRSGGRPPFVPPLNKT